MRTDWRREDWGYAGATLVAAALVGYLVAGNFGLVRTPFSQRDQERARIEVPALAASSQTTEGAVETAASTTAPPSTSGRTQATPAPDLTPPEATVDSPGGASVSLVRGSEIYGSAGDDDSGIDRVTAIFDTGSGEPIRVPAEVTCSDDSRRSCTWTARVPELAGDYRVSAEVVDRAANVGMSSPLQITVVNLGGLVEDLTGGLLGPVGDVAGALLGS